MRYRAPNPRLQRTPLWAPLSRKPLGAAVKLWAGRARSSVWPARADWHRGMVGESRKVAPKDGPAPSASGSVRRLSHRECGVSWQAGDSSRNMNRAPNKSLQRTPLRAPLSRKPLDDER
jgi:hypothetical protein